MAYGVSNPQAFGAWNALSNANRFRYSAMAPLVQQQAMADAFRQGGLSGLMSMGAFNPAANLMAAQGRQMAGEAALQEAQNETALDAMLFGSQRPGGAAAGAPATGLTIEQMLARRAKNPEQVRKADDVAAIRYAARLGPEAGISYLATNRPGALDDYRRSMGLPDQESVRGYESRMNQNVKGIQTVTRSLRTLERLPITEENFGTMKTTIATLRAKMIDPTSAVLSQEVQQQLEGMMSMVEEGLAELRRIKDRTGGVNKDAVERLRDITLNIGRQLLRAEAEGMQAQYEAVPRQYMLPGEVARIDYAYAPLTDAIEYLTPSAGEDPEFDAWLKEQEQ